MDYIRIRLLYSLIVLLFCGVLSCTLVQSEGEIIKILNQITIVDRDDPYLDLTFTKNNTETYLNRDTKLEYVDYFSGNKDSLLIIFNDEVLNNLIGAIKKGYEQKTLKNLLSEDRFIVEEGELPEFLQSKGTFPPFEYDGYYGATRVSTPIIYKDKAIVLESSITGNDLGISIYFLIKNNDLGTWKVFGNGLIHQTSFYQ